ncbi:MAG: CCA tRNA nucleotidyltransferase [Nitrososphaeria archaeon]|nr:CCA tRNA nucleotidyltransferase [Nitrosopumilaceae archaeon]NIP09167.1 CCA tRNA nucleotidyltransferase [Nitrosopumilaceae archaeon]NIP91695.1 CCA tRNA nucleotidyltransferase [Nitrososphaeria archaeon]NIS95535.1 CCA tRNA nucleotidyltransferase [Nitrosopumilaceae archaeon]
MNKIITQAKKLVIPTKSLEKSKIQIANLAYGLVEEQIKDFSEVVGLEFGGSFAKGTWLSESADVDIFIRFKETVPSDKFEEISKKIGFESMKKYHPYVRYSEHPYVEAKIKDTKVNVVPCYDVKLGKWKSSADRSPFHTRHMKKMLTAKMRDEVRLLKTFLQSTNIYGAEVAKQGFSGYVSEVLIINFGSFENVIKSISKIKENQVIGKATKKFDTPIVIMDPIDTNRNLAAAISEENVGRLIMACRVFQTNPSLKFFKKIKPKFSKTNQENILVVKFDFKMRSPDIIWGQTKRAANALSTQLSVGGFNVLKSTGFTDEKKESYLLFLLESPIIPKKYAKIGPDFFREKDCRSFISKNQSKTELMWIDENRKIVSLEKRKNSDAVKFVSDFLKNNLKTGVPKGLQNDFKRGYKVFLGTKNLSKSIKEVANQLTSTDERIFYFN